jgi:hypothetical protein
MAVFKALSMDGWKLEKKWGGFVVEADSRVFMPIDFLPSCVEIKGQRLNVDKMANYGGKQRNAK